MGGAGMIMLLSSFATSLAGFELPFNMTPVEERAALWAYYQGLFPTLEKREYINGVYAIDENLRQQWLEHNEFPPYEFALEEGKILFETPFANGHSYADCFDNGGIAIRQTYPRFDVETGEVMTLERAINRCRRTNDEKPYGWKKGKLAAISAYLAYTSRGKAMAIELPDEAAALAAYERGRAFFYSKRGRLNFACADCHVRAVGKHLRDQPLAPIVGLVNHYPVYGLQWGELGTLHRRFSGCMHQIGAKPLKAQSRAFRELEYYLSFLSNDLPVNGPGIYR
jgi:sulfur-oxidizing protein SoxA